VKLWATTPASARAVVVVWAAMQVVVSVVPSALHALAFNSTLPDFVSAFTAASVHTDLGHLFVGVVVFGAVSVPALQHMRYRNVAALLIVAQTAGIVAHVIGPGPSGPLVGGSFVVAGTAGYAITAGRARCPRWIKVAVPTVAVIELLSVGAKDQVSHVGHVGAFVGGITIGTAAALLSALRVRQVTARSR
jgi:membrane associated rhomboid family serine protease